MNLDATKRADLLRVAGQSSLGQVVTLRARGGAALAAADRDQLLAKAVAREAVELEVELLAFEQFPAAAGKPNRKGTRVRDGAMLATGRSGRGTPFLRDHDWDDVEARGGTVVDSYAEKVEDGHYQIKQTVLLSEPRAVERALRGLMQSVSVGLMATGPVLCSACGTEVLSECWHLPLDEIKLDGGDASVLVEWVFTSAELVETSEVSIPAVPTARVEGIRAAMSAVLHGAPAPKELHMSIKLALAGLLSVAATAGDEEFVSAVQKLKASHDALAAQNKALASEQARLTAEAAAAAAITAAREVEDFIAGAVLEGKLLRGSPVEASLRHFFSVDEKGARGLLAGMPPIVRPELQSAKPAPVVVTATAVEGTLEQYGVDTAAVSKVLAQLGHKNPAATIAAHLPRLTGGGQKGA